MRFLAIGECMAEMAPTDRDGEYRLGFAGDTFNTAWYLARCAPGVKVRYFTAVGDDALSARMTGFMRDGGIDTGAVRTVAGRTVGLYLISLDRGERSFAYWRGQSAARALADDPAALDAAMAAADVVYFSGITLAILPPSGRDLLIAALRKARAAGRTIAFDPNLRPLLWDSPEQMTQAIMSGAAVSDIVLPSFEDEAAWFADADPAATAARYLAVGATRVIVKNGAGAVLHVDSHGSGEVAVDPVAQVVDSTAAGDSFNAGYFAGLAAAKGRAACVAMGCALSRAVVQQRGALVPVDPALTRPAPALG